MNSAYLDKSFKTKTFIENYAIQNHNEKIPLNKITYNNVNFVKADNFAYFLSDNSWQELYYELLQNHFNDLEFDLAKNQTKIKLTDVHTIINKHIDELLIILKEQKDIHIEKSLNPKAGRPDLLTLYSVILYDILTENLGSYINTIYYTIQDRVLNAVLKKELSVDFSYEENQTTFNTLIGKNIINTYYSSFTSLDLFSKKKNNKISAKEIENFEDLWLELFEIYTSNSGLNTKDCYFNVKPQALTNINHKLNTKFNIHIENTLLLNIICKKVLIFGLKAITTTNKSILFFSTSTKLKFNNVNNLDVIQKYLEESLNEFHIMLGNIILNHFININLFQLNLKKEIIKNSNNKKFITSYVVKLKHNLVHELVTNSSSFKPFLKESNEVYNKPIKKMLFEDEISIQFKLNHMLRLIHENPTGTGYFNEESVLKHKPESSSIYLVVDNYFLDIYLKFISKIINKNLSDFNTSEEVQNLLLFLSIYELDFKFLLDIRSETKDIHLIEIIEALISYALDFDELTFFNIKNSLKNIINVNIRTQLEQYIDKINSYKLVLKIALRDLIIYSSFNYFIMPSFFDFRGRRYFLGLSFNIQGYPFLKSFIKIYEPLNLNTLNVDTYNNIISGVGTIIKDSTLKKNFEDYTHDYLDYKQKLNLMKQNFIYSFLDKNLITFEDFCMMLNSKYDFEKLYFTINTYCTKKNRVLMLVSFILLENGFNLNHTPPYVNSYSFDMVTSGYQMLFLLSGNESLGIRSNILGEEALDIYQQTSQMFYKHIKYNYDFIQLFFDKIIKTNIMFDTQNIEDFKLLEPIETLKYFFSIEDEALNEMSSSSIWFIFDKLIKHATLEDFASKLNLNSFKWLIKKQDVSLINMTKDHMFNEMLLILRRQYQLFKILKRNQWLQKHNILQKRGLFKQIIMIELYGGTRNGREKAYKDFIKTTCMELGIIQDYIHNDLKNFFYYVDNFYMWFKKHYLKEVTHLVTLAKFIAKKGKTISIKNPNFTCMISNLTAIKRGKRRTMRVLKGIKPYQLDLTITKFKNINESLLEATFDINSRKQQTSFPPNFIHSMDSMIVHTFLIKNYDLNQYLKQYNIPRFSLVTNHDNFCWGHLLFPLLPFIIKDIYLEIYEYNYFNSLKENLSDVEFSDLLSFYSISRVHKSRFTNSNFMKFG